MKQMKQLKSKSGDLRDLFEHSIKVSHIAEKLQYCQADDYATTVHERMEECDFDVMGIAEGDLVYGYVERCSLATGLCGQYENKFHISDLITESAPLLDLLPILHDKPRIFVSERNQVKRIVTRGDLQKAPVRMLLFGLVSLLEMQLLRVMRSYYRENKSWQSKKLIEQKRLNKAKKELAKRQKRNEAIDLADCLQFCDKWEIVLKTSAIRKALNLGSKTKVEKLLRDAEELRNNLAHSQDLVVGSSWSEVINLVHDIQSLLKKIEDMSVPKFEG